ncbi:hypothetical protein C7N83_13325 [Neisseria iguanae]|uniref:Dystroglycan-type cadherin-like domain-containing protein n=1 Tax=Neisseria iguanae TaxID=90242 RepID=A0A2P7TX74_9NEIS|nr:hypothetical protein C7N83_13325 [Neisseria iguanae]
MSGVAGDELAGKLDLTITAVDAEGLSASQSWTSIINNENHAPEVRGSPDTAYAKVGQHWEFAIPQGYFTGPSGDKLTYRAVAADGSVLPSWLVFDVERQIFSGTTLAAENLKINLVATDA